MSAYWQEKFLTTERIHCNKMHSDLHYIYVRLSCSDILILRCSCEHLAQSNNWGHLCVSLCEREWERKRERKATHKSLNPSPFVEIKESCSNTGSHPHNLAQLAISQASQGPENISWRCKDTQLATIWWNSFLRPLKQITSIPKTRGVSCRAGMIIWSRFVIIINFWLITVISFESIDQT